jgi:hypothetical protein
VATLSEQLQQLLAEKEILEAEWLEAVALLE